MLDPYLVLLVAALLCFLVLVKIAYDLGRIAGALSDKERVAAAVRELLADADASGGQ